MISLLEQALKDAHIPYRRYGEHHHVVGHHFLGVDCPKCGPRTMNFHLGVHEQVLSASCWRCGRQRAWDVLASLGVPTDVLRRIWAGRRSSQPGASKRERGRVRLPGAVGSLLEPHRKYLRSRGFDPDQLAKLWEVGGIGRLGRRFAWRLWVPCYFGGELVSWTTRRIGDAGKRWIMAADDESRVPTSDLLYGWDYVRSAAIVCEGPADVWRIGPGAVCPLGLRLSDAQLALLAAVPRRAVCFDQGSKEQRRADSFCERMANLPGETLRLEIESGDDPAECDDEEIGEIREQVFGSWK